MHHPKHPYGTSLISVLSITAVLLTGTELGAATVNWIAPAPDNYTNPAAWSSGLVPGGADTAVIGNATFSDGAVLYTNALSDPRSTNALASLQMGAVAGTNVFTMSDGVLWITNSGSSALNLGNASGADSTFIQNGGTLVVARPSNGNLYYQDAFLPGHAAGAKGTFTINNGLVMILCGLEIGQSGSGTFNINGGTVIDNGWFGLRGGGNSTDSGTFNMTGGTLYILRNTQTDGGAYSGLALAQNGYSSTANISGGTVYVKKIAFGNVSSANEALNISGGVIYLGLQGVQRLGAAASQTITISGGTFHTANMQVITTTANCGNTNTILSDGADWTWDGSLPVTLMDSSFTVNGMSGPGYVTFAPEAAHTITLSNAWDGVGGLLMTGPGTLAIDGYNSYSGNTTVSGGTLAGAGSLASRLIVTGGTVAGSLVVQGNVSASPGVTISPGSGNTPGTLTLGGNLALDTVTNIIKLSGDPTTIGSGVNDLIQVNGSLSLANVSTIKIVPLAPLSSASPYTVLQYSGTSLTSADVAHLRVISDSPRYTLTIVDPSTTFPYLKVSVSGNAAKLVWHGGQASNPTAWDQTTPNWSNAVTGSLDTFFSGDSVTFDDTAVTNLVTVIGAESSTHIGLSNNATPFTFSGGGPLGGPLDLEGTASLTLAMSNAPTFSSITANKGTLIYDMQGLDVYSETAALSDNGAGQATLVQSGTNTLVLAADNSLFNGTIVVTNGALQYNNALGLAAPAAPLYATNGGSLDLNGVAPGSKNIIIAGNGFHGRGALTSSTGALVNGNGLNNVTMAGDAAIGAANRFDIYQTPFNGNGFSLTEVGPGANIFVDAGETALGDIHIVAGRLGFQGNVTMGNPAKTALVESNATLTFFSAVNASTVYGGENKVLVLNGNATFDSGGNANNFEGPIYLSGTNVFGTRSTLYLWGSLKDTNGPGGFVVGNDTVGNSGGDLYLEGTNTYSGPTIISNRTLYVGAASSLGNSSLIQINSGATLDVTSLASLQIGAGRTLVGSGTIADNTVVVGSGGTLAVGFPPTNTAILTMSGDLTFQSGSTNIVKVNKTAGVANDTITNLNSVTLGGTLIVTNVGTPLNGGDALLLFSASSYSGHFANIIPASPGPALAWDTSSLLTDGTLRVLRTGPSPNPTNIVVSVAAGQITLSWPNDYLGWTLQSQTNAPGIGLTANWADVASSSATNRVTIPIDAASGSVFFRMILRQ